MDLSILRDRNGIHGALWYTSWHKVLISAEVHERVWRIAQMDLVTTRTKHEGTFVAYRVNGIKPGAEQEEKAVRWPSGRIFI